MNDIVEIKNKVVLRWIKKTWNKPLDKVIYDRKSKLVIIKFEYLTDIKYPILHSAGLIEPSTNAFNGMWCAVRILAAYAPNEMYDSYHSRGYLYAAAHTPASIQGLKIRIKDI